MFVPYFFMQYALSFLVLQSSLWGGGGENIIVFLMSCDSYCSVTLPHDAVGWSAV